LAKSGWQNQSLLEWNPPDGISSSHPPIINLSTQQEVMLCRKEKRKEEKRTNEIKISRGGSLVISKCELKATLSTHFIACH
jgi:hypothetical protein